MQPQSLPQCIELSRQLLRAGAWTELNSLCRKLLTTWPQEPQGHYLAGTLAGQAEKYGVASKAFEHVLQLDPNRYDAAVQLARCCVRTGQHARARQLVETALPKLSNNAYLLDVAASVFSHIGLQREAYAAYSSALAIEPNNDLILSNLAASAVFVDEMEQAQQALEKLIQNNPDNARAYWQITRLPGPVGDPIRKQLQQNVARWKNPKDLAYAHYALGKALEDVQQWSDAFVHYQLAANNASLLHRYDAGEHARMIDTIIATYGRNWFATVESVRSDRGRNPLFIVGLPRTGTTLVDSILSSHSAIGSAGELQFLGLAAKQLSGVQTPGVIDAAIMRGAAVVEPAALAERYWRESGYLGGASPLRTDKLPQNFYYLGLIAKAFPRVPIVHVRRHPIDACFAIYKQLFASAYPFSYSLDNLAHFYIDYYRLMAHWRALLGNQLLEISYEDLVRTPEQTIGTLLAQLGLPMESACLDFHQRKSPVATASAAQVREQVHSRSVGRWQHFETELMPLIRLLKEAGIPM